ncbi:hypothetical protein [Haloarchaeobius amylolyticus]|uniref:hypothetical protein n=1 Tax=Haloarchaeobius amylolyticus TaxID=1198296 RepID=UPI00226DE3DE|nr:hypothetical protein [Haloarchaeobius amylolyticus]
MPCSRRSLLRTTGLSLAGGALASLSGCIGESFTSDGGGTTDDPSTDTGTATDTTTDASDRPGSTGTPPALAQWLPSPADSPYHDGYGVAYHDLAAIEAQKEVLHENAHERLLTEASRASRVKALDDYDLGPVDAAMRFGLPGMQVVLGSFDTGAVRDQLTGVRGTYDDGEEHTGTHLDRYRGFDLYDTGPVLAVSADAIVTTGYTPEEEKRAFVEAILDAKAGETDRYADANSYVGALLGLVDDPHALTCYPEAMDGSTTRWADGRSGRLRSWTFGSETTELTCAYTYAEAEQASTEQLASRVSADRFEPYDGLEVQKNGEMVWTTGTLPTNEFDYLSPGGPGDGVHTSR